MVSILVLAQCSQIEDVFGSDQATAAETAPVDVGDPALIPADETPQEVPVSLPVSGTDALGTTIASLGDPAQPGLWMETPLVSTEQTGTARYQGTTVTLTLKPSGGAEGSGSRLSVLAMQALGAPLTDLVEVSVTGAR